VPFQIKEINSFAYLRNPELDGVVRLPLKSITGQTSRPVEGEGWFPTKPGDFILFEDGPFGEVVDQSVERVRIRTMDMIIEYPTADFMNQAFRNLSRSGLFSVSMTFGVDYRHQKECLNEIPASFEQRLRKDFEGSDYAPHLKSLTVDFKEAAANSLDYMILLQFSREAAPRYFAARRFVQRSLVQLCNERDWGIPFAQLTVHRGDGFQTT